MNAGLISLIYTHLWGSKWYTACYLQSHNNMITGTDSLWVATIGIYVTSHQKSYHLLKRYWTIHDDIIKWKYFPCYWPSVRGIHLSLVDSPHKGQWHRALMFSLICAWTNSWANNRDAGWFEMPSWPCSLWHHCNGGSQWSKHQSLQIIHEQSMQ